MQQDLPATDRYRIAVSPLRLGDAFDYTVVVENQTESFLFCDQKDEVISLYSNYAITYYVSTHKVRRIFRYFHDADLTLNLPLLALLVGAILIATLAKGQGKNANGHD